MNNYEHSDLTPSQRRNLILDMMKKKKSVSVHQLSKELYLHEATVRRDPVSYTHLKNTAAQWPLCF